MRIKLAGNTTLKKNIFKTTSTSGCYCIEFYVKKRVTNLPEAPAIRTTPETAQFKQEINIQFVQFYGHILKKPPT